MSLNEVTEYPAPSLPCRISSQNRREAKGYRLQYPLLHAENTGHGGLPCGGIKGKRIRSAVAVCSSQPPCPSPSRNVSVRFKSTSSGTLNGETVIPCSGCLLSRWTGSPAASSITPPLPECSAMSGIMPQGHCRDLAAEGDRNNEDERPCLGSSWHARRDGGTFSYRPLDPLFMCMPLPGDNSRSFRANADGLHEKYARKR